MEKRGGANEKTEKGFHNIAEILPRMIELLDEKVYVANEISAAKHRLGAHEIDLLVLIARKVSGTDYCQVSLSYEELKNVFSEGRCHYKAMRPTFHNLINARLEVYDKVKQQYTICPLVCRVDFAKRSGVATFGIDVFMVRLLQYIQGNSTLLMLRSILSMKRASSKRIYMMCSQFRSTGVLKIPLQTMKERLGMISEQGEQYARFSDFAKYVILPAVKEINEHSDLNVLHTTEAVKGKEVKELCFVLQPKHKTKTGEVVVPSQRSVRYAQVMLTAKVPKWLVNRAFETLNENEVGIIVNRFETHRQNIKSPGGWWNDQLSREGVILRKDASKQIPATTERLPVN